MQYRGSVDRPFDNVKARVFFAFWVISCFFYMAFTLAWDFTMDWGIMRRKGELLRPKLTYHRYYYYAAIVYNIIGRAAWTLSVSVGFLNSFRFNILDLVLALVEVVRRFNWNFFRFVSLIYHFRTLFFVCASFE